MKIKFLLITCLIIVSNNIANSSIDSLNQIKLIIGNFTFDGKLKNLSPTKFEMAINFASIISDKIELIPNKVRDSIAEKTSDILAIAKNLSADYIVFSKINALNYLIRTDITLVSIKDTTNRLYGIGYANAKYKDGATGESVYDPSILVSLQRALADAFKDSAMFVRPDKGMAVYPVPTLVMGSIYYVEDKSLPEWNLFESKVISSYDAVETIMETAMKSPKYVTIDTDTRDSIFAMFNMYIIENYSAVSQHELLALYKMGVDYYISGTFKRIPIGAKLELYLYKFDDGALVAIDSDSQIVSDDNIEKYRDAIKRITMKILKE
jgi:hypothetical protein